MNVLAGDQDYKYTRESKSSGKVLEKTEETHHYESTYQATIDFPNIPKNSVVVRSRIMLRNGTVYTRPTEWIFPNGTLTEVEANNFTFDGCENGAAANLVLWTFPGSAVSLNSDGSGSQTVTANPSPNCSFSSIFVQDDYPLPGERSTTISSGTVAGMQGGFRAEVDVRPQEQMLTLTPAKKSVRPLIPATGLFPEETDQTKITAKVVGGVEGQSVTVDLSISDFDAAAGGHVLAAHHPSMPPERTPDGQIGMGELVGGDNLTTSSCTLTLKDTDGGPQTPPEGSCDVVFKSGVIGGIATIDGEIDGSDPAVTAQTKLTVAVPLVDVSAIFNRPGERVRGGKSQHANAYFLDPRVIPFALRFQQDWENVTKSPTYPEGTYLSLNDMSLGFGGLFDIYGDWSTPHNSHRLGTSVDVNINNPGPFDVATGAQVVPGPGVKGVVADPHAPGGVRVDKFLFKIVCRKVGGIVVREEPAHCDWRGQF